MPEFVNLEVRDAVALVTLNRPPMNALSIQVQSEIYEIAMELAANQDVRAVVLHGGDRLFAAGADVKEMSELDYQAMIPVSIRLQEIFSAVARLPQPTIAAITGFALGGGCELALACDFRVAADNSRLGQPEMLLGLIPGAGGTQRLPRLIGASRAKELIFSGRFVDAQEALAIGLVNEVVAPDQVLPRSLEWAEQLAAGPRIAMQSAKRVIDRGMGVDLDAGLELERQAFSALFATEDRSLGMESFLANGPGKARFAGR